MKTAVVVTTYNQPAALALLLDGFSAQTTLDFEVVIADDGSTEDTRTLVLERAGAGPLKISHVWQEDRGFRIGAARNRAVAATDADYIIFSDGDCIPSQNFVANHIALAERGWLVAGNRILLSRAFTQRVFAAPLSLHTWTRRQWTAAWLRRDINQFLPIFTLPDGGFRKWQPLRWKGIKTCNLALWRSDFKRVNGFDESYSGWGLEDSDLVIRLLRTGARHKSARCATPMFHLWHAESDRSHLDENRRRLEALLASDCVLAQRGLDQY
jgi:glycosyltransferase involved in cell wall biosynthesis